MAEGVFRAGLGGSGGSGGGGGGGGGGVSGSTADSRGALRTLQLPGCVGRRRLASLAGTASALADALCLSRTDGFSLPRPLAVAILQLESTRPTTATPRQAARAELWRLTLLQSLADVSGPAARAGLKCDVSFNTGGMRLLVSGYGSTCLA